MQSIELDKSILIVLPLPKSIVIVFSDCRTLGKVGTVFLQAAEDMSQEIFEERQEERGDLCKKEMKDEGTESWKTEMQEENR